MVLPVGSCSLLTSQYLTVSISVERYCGICYPLQSRVRGGRRLVIYLLPVILFREERIERDSQSPSTVGHPTGSRLLFLFSYVLVSLVFNIPKFMEISDDFTVNWDFSNNLLYNKIYKYVGLAIVFNSNLGLRQYMELLVTVVVPWVVLFYLNMRIYLAVRLKTIR